MLSRIARGTRFNVCRSFTSTAPLGDQYDVVVVGKCLEKPFKIAEEVSSTLLTLRFCQVEDQEAMSLPSRLDNLDSRLHASKCGELSAVRA